jgi:putative FmdB family regulatory protein
MDLDNNKTEVFSLPFYDLRCTACGAEFNIRATLAERAQRQITCPDCAGHELLPVFKTAHFTVKSEEIAPACPNSHICGAGCRHMH